MVETSCGFESHHRHHKTDYPFRDDPFYFCLERDSNHLMQMSGGHLLDSGWTESTPQCDESHHRHCQSRLVWRLLPNDTNLSTFRISRQNRIGGGNLIAVIQMGVNIGGGSNITVSEPFLNILQRNTVGIQQAGAAMPLRYNYDKPEKPRISRVFGYQARFFILFQPEKSSREVVIS